MRCGCGSGLGFVHTDAGVGMVNLTLRNKTSVRVRKALYGVVKSAANSNGISGELADQQVSDTLSRHSPMRTTESEITFIQPFTLESLMVQQKPGTYRVVVDEERIDRLSFAAYKRVATYIEIPAITVTTGKRRLLQVSREEIAHALKRDSELEKFPSNFDKPIIT